MSQRAFSSARKVLVVLENDGDRFVLEKAAAFAAVWGAEIGVLAVVEPPGDLARIARAAQIDAAAIERDLEEAAQGRIEAALTRVAITPAPRSEVRAGKAFIEIVRHAQAHGYDLVMKAIEAHGRFPHTLFASTDQHLLRKCHCPVWLLRPEPRPGPVIAAVDVDSADADEPATLEALNDAILNAAAQAAAMTGGEVHVVTAWDGEGDGLVRAWAQGVDPDAAAAAYAADAQLQNRNALDRLIAGLKARLPAPPNGRKIDFLPHAARGTPRRAIPEITEALQAELLVVGTIARTGVPGFIIGNTAEDVLNSVDCAVLTVKPPHFVSPLTP